MGLSKNRFSVEELVGETGFERSTIQKALSRLVKSGLVNRFQENLADGGYRFWYVLSDKNGISKKVTKQIQEWSKSASTEVESWLMTNSKK